MNGMAVGLSTGSARLGLHLRQRATLILLALGILAAVAHAMFRFPLRLPGHHGLEWMALLVIARQLSSYRWAGSVAASGAAVASMLPVLGFHPLAPLTYIGPAIVLDLAYGFTGQARGDRYCGSVCSRLSPTPPSRSCSGALP